MMTSSLTAAPYRPTRCWWWLASPPPPPHPGVRVSALRVAGHAPQALDPALGPALQELLAMCRACVQQRSALEQEAKERKAKGSRRRIIIIKNNNNSKCGNQEVE